MPGKKSSAKTKKAAIQNMSMEKMMLLLIGLDQAAKSWIDSRPDDEFPRPVPDTDETVVLYKKHNPGLPFGALADHEELTKLIPVAVTSVLAGDYVYLKSRNERKLLRLALALALSGSLSNIADRYTRGYVVDYLCFRAGDLKKVVFNLGDLCVFSGGALLLALEIVSALGIRRG